jgi:hypothetical protein
VVDEVIRIYNLKKHDWLQSRSRWFS